MDDERYKPETAVALGGDFQLKGDLTNPDTRERGGPLQELEPQLRIVGSFDSQSAAFGLFRRHRRDSRPEP